jgi:hypothetical protein
MTTTHLSAVAYGAPRTIAPRLEGTAVASAAAAAVAESVAAATVQHRWWTASFFAALGHVHWGVHWALPEAHTARPRREGSYFEAGRMSRMMDHL